MKEGLLIVISGFSGAGKGSIVKSLLSKYDNYALSISATTRAKRETEEHGREYFFLSKDDFVAMIEKGEFIEYARYVDNYYGTPKSYVEEKLRQGFDVILEIEIQGAIKIKEQFPESVLIFVSTKDADILEERLRTRNTEDDDQIAGRLSRSVEEAEYMEDYDYILINDKLEEVVAQLDDIINTEHRKVSRNKELVKDIQLSLKTKYSKEI